MTLDAAIISAVAALLGIIASKLLDAWRDRRTRVADRARLEAGASGDWSRALLVDQAAFRQDLLGELERMRAELRTHDQRCDERCDEKIAVAIKASEEKCREEIARKLRGQAASLRAEFKQQLAEMSEGT